MPETNQIVCVAVVQARSVFGDLEASLGKLEELATEAQSKGAQLVAFGETWLPGYPVWLDVCPGAALWDHTATRKVHASLRQNSVVVPSATTARIGACARRLGIVLVVGVNERVVDGPGHGTLYNSLLTFGVDGELINHHRKLVPTYTEKLVWGYGDGAGLQAVATEFGRVGGLVCWEHWMPLARQALHESAEQIHVAVWPTVKDMHQVACRQYAFEGRCFVLAAGGVLAANELPESLGLKDDLRRRPESLVMRGGSAIIAPDGRYLAGPVFDEETVLVAKLRMAEIEELSLTLDVTGHYARPDVFGFEVERGRR